MWKSRISGGKDLKCASVFCFFSCEAHASDREKERVKYAHKYCGNNFNVKPFAIITSNNRSVLAGDSVS